jgi:ribosomal-protein-alanine N-acetyltransferase
MAGYSLRRMTIADVEALHELLAVPEVKHFLTDGIARSLDEVRAFHARSDADFAAAGVGVWLLEDEAGVLVGCVWLQVDAPGRAAELSYLLAPGLWGRGLATRMGATAIREAFRSGSIDRVFAGADWPNTRSFAVMRRLGMRYARDVQYTVYAGEEYEIRIGDDSSSWPESLAIRDEAC